MLNAPTGAEDTDQASAMNRIAERLAAIGRTIYLNVYLAGYGGTCPPRWLRRRFARTELHRAWLAGFMGIYTDSQPRGVCDRATYHYRKAFRHPCPSKESS